MEIEQGHFGVIFVRTVITRMFRIEPTPQPRPLPSHRSVSRCSDVTEVEELCEVFENHGDQRTGRQTLL